VTTGALGTTGGELAGGGVLTVGVEPAGVEARAGGVVLFTVVVVARASVRDDLV
jgi:hypothetical protein